MTVIDFTNTHTLDNPNMNAVLISACVSGKNEDNVMSWLIWPLSLVLLQVQHSTHLQTAVSHRRTATYCVHSHTQITGTILTALQLMLYV